MCVHARTSEANWGQDALISKAEVLFSDQQEKVFQARQGEVVTAVLWSGRMGNKGVLQLFHVLWN